MTTQPDPYVELGLPPEATHAEVQDAFRRLVRQHHPDTRSQRGPETDVIADQRLQRILMAYATLRARAASPAPQGRADNQPQPPRRRPANRPPSAESDLPLRATPVRWLPPSEPIPKAAAERHSRAAPTTDWIIRWLFDH